MPGSPKLDLASSVINLNKSLIDFVPSSGSLVNISRDTYDWIVRERIDESAFQRCKELALGLAFPNKAGVKIKCQIQDQDQKLLEGRKRAPVRLVVSGSLGRLLAKDVNTCYMVSTVATLTQFHSPGYACDVLCSMMLDEGGHEEKVSTKYYVQRSPIKAVVSKIVDSIYLNVVNAGHNLSGLPEELKHLHPHFLPDITFAGIVMGIQRTANSIIIRSDRFLPDLALWLLYHFEGRIEVSVKNGVLFEKKLGASSRIVRLMVKDYCPSGDSDQKCDREIAGGAVEAFMSVGDDLFTFLRGSDSPSVAFQASSRQPLYEVEQLAGVKTPWKYLNRPECNAIAAVAKSMMRWLLKVPIVYGKNEKFGFNALLNSTTKPCLSIADLLPNHPGLLHFNTGLSEGPEFVVRRPDSPTIGKPSPSKIVKWLPTVQGLLDSISPRCPCDECKSGADLEVCKEGCLRDAAVTRLFVLLVHGICDATGVQDVSGNNTSESQCYRLSLLLLDLFYSQEVVWDTWFELVASATVGISSEALSSFGRVQNPGASSWAAAQSGSFVLIASCLDLRKEARLKGCFGVITSTGNLQGVPDGLALVRCEEGTRIEEPPRDFYTQNMPEHDFESQPTWLTNELDLSTAEIYTAIFREDSFKYRLLTTVRAGRTIRIVEPAQMILSLAASHRVRCSHEPDFLSNESFNHVKVGGFDDLLAGDGADFVSEGMVLSKNLDTHLKLNTLLSMAWRGCVVRNIRSCCMNCAMKTAVEKREQKRHPNDLHTIRMSSWLLNIDIPDGESTLYLEAS